MLDVRNEGAARSSGCRAELVRCERREAVGWLRVEARRALSGAGTNPPGVLIPAGGVARVELDRILPEGPGVYRLDIAVRNGEEKRSSYVVYMEAVSPGASS